MSKIKVVEIAGKITVMKLARELEWLEQNTRPIPGEEQAVGKSWQNVVDLLSTIVSKSPEVEFIPCTKCGKLFLAPDDRTELVCFGCWKEGN